jgi:predicted deacylase
MTTCPRCQGLTFDDDVLDLHSGEVCRMHHCVSCGSLTDPVSEANRMQSEGLFQATRRKRVAPYSHKCAM